MSLAPLSVAVEPFDNRVLGNVLITALPAQVDLSLYQGDDFALQLAVFDPDDEPADLAGVHVRSHIRANVASPTVAGQFWPFLNENRIGLWLPGSVSSGLPLACVWDVEIVRPQGWTTTLAAGRLMLRAEVTR